MQLQKQVRVIPVSIILVDINAQAFISQKIASKVIIDENRSS